MITQEQLEAKVTALGGPNNCEDLSTLTDDQVFALLAWELWKDGMDWNQGVPEIAEGKFTRNNLFNTREGCVLFLKSTFGY